MFGIIELIARVTASIETHLGAWVAVADRRPSSDTPPTTIYSHWHPAAGPITDTIASGSITTGAISAVRSPPMPSSIPLHWPRLFRSYIPAEGAELATWNLALVNGPGVRKVGSEPEYGGSETVQEYGRSGRI